MSESSPPCFPVAEAQPTYDLLGPPGTRHGLDPGVVNLWRLQGMVRLLLVILPGLGLAAYAAASWAGPVAAALVASVGGSLFAFQVLFWPPLSHARYHFAVREHDLWIARGVLFRQETVIPLDRIQHVDSHEGPLERIFGLSRVLVHTASGMAPDGGIPGLPRPMAVRLRDTLALRRGDDGV